MNDAKTWYYHGLIYASLDTTSNEAYKALATDAYKTAVASFKKADELNGKDKELFITDASGLPLLKSQQVQNWANGYLNTGASQYQEEDLEGACIHDSSSASSGCSSTDAPRFQLAIATCTARQVMNAKPSITVP